MSPVTGTSVRFLAYTRAVRVGVPKELEPGERRVALIPDAVARLSGAGFEVAVERGAGTAASFRDEAYSEAGAELTDSAWEAEAVVKVRKPTPEEAARLHEGQVLIGFLEPLTDREGIERLVAQGVHAFALESIP